MPVTLGFLLFSGPLGGIFSFGSLVAASQVAIGLGLSVGAQLLFGAKKPDTPKPEDGKFNLRQNVPSMAVVLGRVKKGGDYVLLEETNGDAFHVMVNAGHRINAYVGHYLHDEAATFDGSGLITAPSHFGDEVRLKSRLGLDVETAYAELIAAMPTIWTADHRGDGLASVLLVASSTSAENYQRRFPQGMPVPTSVMEGALLYDPREVGHDPEDDDTWEFSENLALERLWHLTHPSGGKMTLDDMELADWINAANVCDEEVQNKAGDDEPRYHGGFWYRYENDPVQVGRVLDQAAEMVLYETADGKVGVHAGEYVAPDIRLTENDILNLVFDANRRKNSNVLAVRGRYTDPGKVYNTVDAAIYGDPYIGDSSERSKTVENVAVQRHNHIQRLQAIAFIRANAPRVQLLCDYEPAKNVPYRRFIKVHYPPKLDEAIIEITGRPKLSLRNLTYEIEGIVIPSTLYDFVAATDEGDLPADYDEVVHSDVPAPVGFDVAIQTEVLTGGQSAAYGLGTWTAQSDALLLEMEWEPTAGGATQSTRTKTGDTNLRSGFLADGAEYKFRARNWSAGVASEWTSYVTKTIVVNPTPPLVLVSASAVGGMGNAVLTITAQSDPILQRINIYRVAAGGVLDKNTDPLVTTGAMPGMQFVVHIGDTTTVNMMANPGLDTDTIWTKGSAWTIAGGVAHKANTAGNSLGQTATFNNGSTYRYKIEASSVSGGNFTPRLLGGVTQNGTVFNASGTQYGSIASSGNTAFSLIGATAAVGDMDNIVVFLQTAGSIPQAIYDLHVFAVNPSGIESASAVVVTNVAII